jgi:hypothetical protein
MTDTDRFASVRYLLFMYLFTALHFHLHCSRPLLFFGKASVSERRKKEKSKFREMLRVQQRSLNRDVARKYWMLTSSEKLVKGLLGKFFKDNS